jgi:GNAT superfamily N-acetyltransferase
VSRLVGAYLRRTEEEKARHLDGTVLDDDAELPVAYRAEVARPAAAYAGAVVHLAELDGVPVGVLVTAPVGGTSELKRLWADPAARGRGVGSALLDAAVRDADGPLRLSVWDWRLGVLRLYESRGFVRVPSWDARPRLVCLRRER